MKILALREKRFILALLRILIKKIQVCRFIIFKEKIFNKFINYFTGFREEINKIISEQSVVGDDLQEDKPSDESNTTNRIGENFYKIF